MGWFNNLSLRAKFHLVLNPMFIGAVVFGWLYAQELRAQGSESANLVIAVVVFIIVSSLILGLSLYRNLVVVTTGIVQQLEEGAKTNDVSHRLPENSTDEVGRISHTVNMLLESLCSNLSAINGVSEKLGLSAEHSQQAIQESSSLLQSQLNETNQLATAIEEMSATAQEIAKNTAQAAEAAHATQGATVSGSEIVSQSVDAVVSLSANISDVGERVGSLASRSEQVSSVLDVIKSVAEQTNLLALNAAIEAARAGEQGRGFAVVADEVRTLASRTQDSAEEIAEIVAGLQTESSTANSVVQNCVDSAEKTVGQVTGLTEVLAEVERSASVINDMSVQIAAASEQQVATSVHISENVVRVDTMAQENNAKVNQLAETAAEHTELASELKGMVSVYKI